MMFSQACGKFCQGKELVGQELDIFKVCNDFFDFQGNEKFLVDFFFFFSPPLIFFFRFIFTGKFSDTGLVTFPHGEVVITGELS